jgi:hypothetical protein
MLLAILILCSVFDLFIIKNLKRPLNVKKWKITMCLILSFLIRLSLILLAKYYFVTLGNINIF